MNRRYLFVVIGLLVAGIVVGGIFYSQQGNDGVDIKIGDQGISIKSK